MIVVLTGGLIYFSLEILYLFSHLQLQDACIGVGLFAVMFNCTCLHPFMQSYS